MIVFHRCILPVLAVLLSLKGIQCVPSGNKLSRLPEDCGTSVIDRTEGTPVLGYPWMAVLRYRSAGQLVDSCSGTLINQRYVLTAAHCLKTRQTLSLQSVILGEHTKTQDIDCNGDKEVDRECAEPVEEFGIESVLVHPNYNKPRYSNDIGLIRLDSDVLMKDHIHPVCLPTSAELREKSFDSYIVTGWGQTDTQAEIQDALFGVTLPHVSIADCQRMYNESRHSVQLSDSQLCAGSADSVNICRGFAGAPLGHSVEVGNRDRFVQFGIVSFGSSSCQRKEIPGVYTRVASHMNWILNSIKPWDF